jgi:metallo-beta-lactamase family protein
MPKVTFLGAFGCVTGSCTHLDWGRHQMLVDCGLFQGDEALELRNREPFGFRPSELTAVVATHAHLDHTGRLPLLVAQGFRGPIYCTSSSRPLISLVLLDAAKIQEEEVRYARRKGYSKHPNPTPLYTQDDARKALRQLQTLPFDEEHELFEGIRFHFRRAGHLLGAASIEISGKGSDGERHHWCFSGDVGRCGVPILHDPEPPREAPDTLLLESTYGDRRHPQEDTTGPWARSSPVTAWSAFPTFPTSLAYEPTRSAPR